MNLKEKIIHEGLRLYSLKGFSNTSIQDIMKAADTSKGGFYNHFKSKEELFYEVLKEARKIWRERNLAGLDETDESVEKVSKLLRNYSNRYLKDAVNFPGGCVFITLSAELNDQCPHLSKEIDKGFEGLKNMIARLLKNGQESGILKKEINTTDATELIFNGMLGASIRYSASKSSPELDRTINSLIGYLENLKP